MAILDRTGAEFNRLYQLDLDTLNSRIYLQFDKRNQWKRLNQVAVDGMALAPAVAPSWQVAANDEIMSPIIIIRGQQTTFLSGATPFPTPVLPVGAFTGDLILFYYQNLRIKPGFLTFNPGLLIEPDQTLSITFLRPFTSLTGVSVNTRTTVTIFGEYIPVGAGADLTKERYLNIPAGI